MGVAALGLFKWYPVLSSERVLHLNRRGDASTSMFRFGGLRYQDHKRSLQAFPGALAYPQGEDNESVLNMACAMEALDENLVSFLARMYPKGVSQRNNYKQLPIQCLVKRSCCGLGKVSLRLIKTMASIYPESMECRDEPCGSLLLQELSNSGYDLHALGYACDGLQKHVGRLDIHGLESCFWDMDLRRAGLLGGLLPQLATLHSAPPSRKAEGFSVFLII
jgi:hypothetical protein